MVNNFSNDYKNVFGNNPLSLVRRYFFLTVYGVVKYLPTPFGEVFRTLLLKLFVKKLDTYWVREGVTFHFPENIEIGKSVLGEFVYLNGYGDIEIGDDVIIGASTKLYSHDHKFDDLSLPIRQQGLEKKKIIIKDDVYIGCNVTILGGVTIQKGVVIGAGSVVTKDIPENSIVAGMPAKVIGTRSESNLQKEVSMIS